MLRTLYLVNAALLIVHEIDSAYWREWELFHLPGGLPAFLVLHVPLGIGLLWGYEQVLRGSPAGLWMSLASGVAGLFALLVHGWFLLEGRPEFRSIASIAVLASTGAVSLAQAAAVATAGRRRVAPRTRPGPRGAG